MLNTEKRLLCPCCSRTLIPSGKLPFKAEGVSGSYPSLRCTQCHMTYYWKQEEAMVTEDPYFVWATDAT